jgi:hypothetical protein
MRAAMGRAGVVGGRWGSRQPGGGGKLSHNLCGIETTKKTFGNDAALILFIKLSIMPRKYATKNTIF